MEIQIRLQLKESEKQIAMKGSSKKWEIRKDQKKEAKEQNENPRYYEFQHFRAIEVGNRLMVYWRQEVMLQEIHSFL